MEIIVIKNDIAAQDGKGLLLLSSRDYDLYADKMKNILDVKESQASPSNTIREIYTDGAAVPNPGVGGWATVVVENDNAIVYFGCEHETTNNRMELQAVIKAFSLNFFDQEVIIYSDSEYVVKGAMTWMFNWEKKGWVKVKNLDLWKKLYELRMQKKNIRLEWVRGHNGNKYNEIADHYAGLAIKTKSDGVFEL